MTSQLAWALVAGVGLGCGLALVVFASPMARRPRFVDRVAPALRSTNFQTGLFDQDRITGASWGVATSIFGPVIKHLMAQLDRFSIDAEQLQRKLDKADSALSVSDYRVQQLSWGVVGALLGALVNCVAWLSGSFHGLFAALSVVTLAVLGVGLRYNVLSARIRQRESRMLQEFPTVAEMFALAVSAGESAPGAFERIGRVSRGELARELDRVLRQTRAGASFTSSLKTMSYRVDSAPISRFLEGVIVAIDRGTPLAEVMHAQARDVRDLSKRDLMESAGKKEIGMLVPLVFGVLPLTIIFAIYPGLSLLSLGVCTEPSMTSGASAPRSRTPPPQYRITREELNFMTVFLTRLTQTIRSMHREDRGDVPGWVMITLMSAVIVAGLLAIAQPALQGLFNDAINQVSR